MKRSRGAFWPAAAAGFLTLCVLSAAARGSDEEITQLIKETIAGSKSSADAAAKLMGAAKMLGDTPKVQSLFCRKAYDYGVRTAAGQNHALEAMEILIRIEPRNADEWGQKRISLYRRIYARSKPNKRLAVGTRLVALLRELADSNAAKGQWNSALKLYSAAMRTAAALKLEDRIELAARIRDVSVRVKQAQRLESLKKKLQADPDNDSVRNEIIRIRLLEDDSPEKAAELVTEDGDEMLRTYLPLAAKALNDLPEAACLELGRWYRSLADDASLKARKITALNRATGYLERYLELHVKQDVDRDKASSVLIAVLAAKRKLLGSLIPQGAVLAVTFERRTLSTSGGRTYIVDASGKRHRGLMVGGSLVSGRAGQAMKFDGKAYVDFGSPKSLQITGSQTVCMWLKPANLSARQNPINKAYGGEGTWTIELNGTVHHFCGSSGKNDQPYAGYRMVKPLKPGQWAHLTVVTDIKAGKLLWYKDGQLVSSVKLKYRPAASKYPLLIGKGYVRNYHGLLDELAIFNRALSAKEIDSIFQMGRKGLTLK